MSKRVVLVVDDEPMNREVCKDALELDGYEVLMAAGTKEATALLSARSVDAVVCDIHMPHNGVLLYEHLLKTFPHLRDRFLFVTGDPSRVAQLERLPHAARYLLRPFPIRVLLDSIRSTLIPAPEA